MTASGEITAAPTLTALLRDGDMVASPAVLADRARGAMLGLAAGNLLGRPLESNWYYDIDRRHPNRVLEIDPRGKFLHMDDDLAQAVALAEALLAGGDLSRQFADRMIVWLKENGRGCGRTTRSAIRLLAEGVAPPDATPSVYEDWGRLTANGGVMRCAPVAIARRRNPELIVSDSAATCAVTHYAPACQWSCIIINVVIARLLDGIEPDLDSIIVAAAADGCPALAAIARADGIAAGILDAIVDGQKPPAGIDWLRYDHRIIGHTLLTLQAGLWAAATPLGFEEALIAVISAGGDTDTNAGVAGAVLGARYGASAIPQRWLDCIPEWTRIEMLVDGLLAMGGL